MTDNVLVQVLLQATLVILVLLLGPVVYRLYRGPRIADRLLAVDLITTMLVGIIIVLSVMTGQPILVEVAIALAALSFIGSLAFARYVSEGRVF